MKRQDLAHGKHIPNRVLTPLTHLNMANEQGSVLQGFAVMRVGLVLITTRKSPLSSTFTPKKKDFC